MILKVKFSESKSFLEGQFAESAALLKADFAGNTALLEVDFAEISALLKADFVEESALLKADFVEEVLIGVPDEDDPAYILVAQDGTEFQAVLVNKETVFTATANDIRIGKTAVTEQGVTKGTKVIPSYHTNEGFRFITSGSVFETGAFEEYDFTRLQVIICPFNGSISESVAAEIVAINEGVYAVNSTELIAKVTRDDENHKISLGIVNETENTYLLRYFTYKEIY